MAALAEYDARGRVYHGPQDRVYDDAVMLWLNDYLSGQESLLMATSNETAAVLARLARERLTELGLVDGEARSRWRTATRPAAGTWSGPG